MTLLYDDGRQGEVNLIASRDSIVHLGNVDFENLTVNLKPKTVAAGEKAVGLGAKVVDAADAVEAILVHTLDTLGGRTAHVAVEAGERA